MLQPHNNAFGLPSVPRQSLPSMFEILSWPADKQTVPKKHQTERVTTQPDRQNPTQAPLTHKEGNIVDNTSQVDSVEEVEPKRVSKSTNTKYQLYEYRDDKHKRAHSQRHSETVGSKVEQVKKIEPKRKLDPSNQQDKREIEERKQRIKKFEYVTRDLPNSAFTTYYGKPTFEAYGRGNSNPSLLSHNVMPHRGANNPKQVQSYYTALLKGKKQSTSIHVPRKPIEEKVANIPQKKQQIIQLPLQKPDLINNVRFTSEDPRKKQDVKIPTNKITPLKQKNVKKSARKDKKKSSKAKPVTEISDGLKYMNTRENLLKIIESKKVNTSKLAYKVTECYPFEWEDEQKLKESTRQWDQVCIAGKPSTRCDKVGDLLRPCNKTESDK